MKVYAYNIRENYKLTVYGTAINCANDLQVNPRTIIQHARKNTWTATDYKFGIYGGTFLFVGRELDDYELQALKEIRENKNRYNYNGEKASARYHVYNQRNGDYLGEYSIQEMQNKFVMPAMIAIINSIDKRALRRHNLFVSTVKAERLQDPDCWRYDFINPDLTMRFSTYRPELLSRELSKNGEIDSEEHVVRVFINPEQEKYFPNYIFDYENADLYLDNE